MRWLVDGMNVIGSRPNRWWEDRPRAMRDLIEELERFAAATGDEVTVVFDGRPLDPPPHTKAVDVSFAPRRGRNAADDEIAYRVAVDGEPASLRVVTSDGELASRVRDTGADVEGAGAFRRRLDSV
jgi:predicted RNA-binding protein with PIN domain